MASFIFGGDTGETAETLARRRAIADALLGQDIGAPKTIGDGIAALGKGIAGYMAGKAVHKQEADFRKGGDGVFSALFGGPAAAGNAAPSSSGAVAAALSGSPGMGGAAGPTPDLSGNDIYSGFMDTVKSKITNPNGLAAVASTGNAESRFQPKNAFGSWSDPSESGAAGTAGGILSWRGPRFEAMRNFAAKNGGDANNPSPQLQAQFFLQEDPTLIDRLNAAKSPTEAQQIMNNAWKFAGYDRPGGEAARRIAQANSFASRFTGSTTDPVRVASLDPSAGMAPAAGGAVASALVAPTASAPQQTPAQALSGAPVPAVQSPRATDSGGAPMLGANRSVNAGGAPASQGGGVQVAGSGPTVQQLMQAVQDPRLSAQQRGVVSMLLKQKMDQADPATQLEMEKNRLDMEKTRLETERLRNPQMTPAEKARLDFDQQKFDADQKKLIEVGGSLVDPNTHQAVYTGQQTDWEKLDDNTLYNKRTGASKAIAAGGANAGQFRFKGNAVDAQALNGLMDAGPENGGLTVEQAQQLAAGKTITDPSTGAVLFMTPQAIFSRPKDGGPPKVIKNFSEPAPGPSAPIQPPPAGAPAPAAPGTPRAENAPTDNTRPGMIQLTDAKPEKAMTQDQSNAATFADRMRDAIGVLDNSNDVGKEWWGQAVTDNQYIPDFLEGELVNGDFQKFDQARRNFINAQLRRESGATIQPDEFANANRQYLPMPGDTKETLAQKKQNRQTVMEGMARGAGPTYRGGADDLKQRYGLD